jgi:hypothetical protein
VQRSVTPSPLGLLAYLLLASTMGCILLVTPEEHGEHCQVRGSETDCGRCLEKRCRTELDDACFDDAVLGPTEECAVSGNEACDRLVASALTTCVRSRCDALCYARSGTSVTRCTESFVSAGLACSCEVSNAPNDLACNPEKYPRTLCCAPSGWPGPALDCSCNAVSCVALSNGCICTLTDNLDERTADTCPGKHCCAIDDRCQCGDNPCQGQTREVPSCNRAELRCPNGQHAVDSCSIRQ